MVQERPTFDYRPHTRAEGKPFGKAAAETSLIFSHQLRKRRHPE